ncbi:DUF2232 domain-containing protein [Desulfobulbus alkaliphilus]|uniref:DUF2232 domain-containing protein n=1 Tax=Desulfobulbus alkaliphilus TaxID=869814 RepID=UPI0019640AA2|nr:DUF2232 domain-containing protein [Desulfobulbus alkaliphilus]MBM9537171.1 DUF2232 domain-containing protein [Desulfobulbus alkaliphilus]
MLPTGAGWNHAEYPPGQLLLFSAFFFVPALSPVFFGWTNGLLAVPVFYLLFTNGFKSGFARLRVSLLIAGLGALLIGRLEVFLFSLTLIPLGYTLFRSANAGESAATSGGKGVVVLALTWILFWAVYGAATGISPYRQLLDSLDQGFRQTVELYESREAEVPGETLHQVQQLTDDIREIIPRILPGVLASIVVVTVWINLAFSNIMAHRLGDVPPPWGKYSTWKLPDQLLWVAIIAGAVMLLGRGLLQFAGSWVLMLAGLLYFFQGLAVCIALMERWKVPVYVRILLYFILVIQTYGILLLAFVGVADVWFNFRRPREEP